MYDGRKSYSYVKAKSIDDAKSLFEGLNNKYIPTLGMVVFCGFAVEVPFESFHAPPLHSPKMVEKSLPGAMIFPDFISIQEVLAFYIISCCIAVTVSSDNWW